MEKRIDRSNQFIEKYGAMSIIFGYFVPGIRQVLPLIMGISTFKALRFMWIAFGDQLFGQEFIILWFYHLQIYGYRL